MGPQAQTPNRLLLPSVSPALFSRSSRTFNASLYWNSAKLDERQATYAAVAETRISKMLTAIVQQ